MRSIAFGLVMVVLLSFLVVPLVEVACLMREKVIVSTAVSNSCRSAKDTSLREEAMQDLDAVVDKKRFMEYYADTFCKILNLDVAAMDVAGGVINFTSKDGRYNDFLVIVQTADSIDLSEQTVSRADIRVESVYKFKTKYLQLAERAYPDLSYKLTAKRSLDLSVKN